MSLGAIWKAKEPGDLKGSGVLNREDLVKALAENEGNLRIALFVNTYKKAAKHPDLNIVLSTMKAEAPKQSTKPDSIFK